MIKTFLLKFLKTKETKNAMWLIGGRVAQMLLSLFVGILTARYLGPSNYGLIGYVGAFTAFFTSFCTLGINSILVKEFIDSPDEEGTVIGSSLVLRTVSSLLSAITIVAIICFVDANETDTIIISVLCSIGLIFNVFEVFNYWFQAHLKSKVTAIATLTAYFITAVYRLVLVITGQKVYFFALATSVDYICIAIILFVVYYKCGGKKLGFSWNVSKRILGRSHHFILSGLMVAIYGHTDKFMLKQMIDETQVGYYNTAVAVCSMWCFVLQAIIDSMYPSIMEAGNTDERLFEKLNRRLYTIVFYVSIGVSFFFLIFAPIVINVLYGAEYSGAINPLRIITWYTAFSYLGVARNAWIVVKGCQKYLKYIYFAAVICNVALNFALIPLWGAQGAAIASLISQILTSIVLPLFIKPLRKNSVLMLEAIVFKGIK